MIVLDLQRSRAVVAQHRLRVAVVAVTFREPRVDHRGAGAVEHHASLEVELRFAVHVAAIDDEMMREALGSVLLLTALTEADDHVHRRRSWSGSDLQTGEAVVMRARLRADRGVVLGREDTREL